MFLSFLFAVIASVAPVTVEDAADATYKVVAYDGDPFAGGEKAWSGTAWKLTDKVAISAGHVCFNDLEPGHKLYIRLVNANDQSWPATVTKVAYDPEGTPGQGVDLCKLTIDQMPGDPLRLAESLPTYNAPLFVVGAARGVWGPERPIFHGWYGGGNYMTVGAAGGASGSAVVTEDGVIGVLVAGIPGTPMTWFVPVDALRDFLSE